MEWLTRGEMVAVALCGTTEGEGGGGEVAEGMQRMFFRRSMCRMVLHIRLGK